MLTHMHMVLFTWWCWHICKGEGVGVDVDQLVGKKVTGGRSGHVGRTVRQFDSFSSREVVSLAWAERLDCGRSDQGVRTVRGSLNKLTRDVLGL